MKYLKKVGIAFAVVALFDYQSSIHQTQKISLLQLAFSQSQEIEKLEYTVSFLRGQKFDRLATEEDEEQTRQALQEMLEQSKIDIMEFPDIKRLITKATGADIPLVVHERERVLRSIPNILPAKGWISSLFGKKRPNQRNPRHEVDHKGLDISNLIGTPIYAPADGVVRFSGKNGSFGNYLSVLHGYGFVTKYGHLSKLLVRSDEEVKRGQLIALMGNSGQSRGVHLHYEVWVNDKPRDPAGFVPNFDFSPRFLVVRGFKD